jgi:hypothetical protein
MDEQFGAGDEMRSGRKKRLSTALLALAALLAAHGQTAGIDPGPRGLFTSASASGMAQASGEIVREIDDPHTGNRWLLMRDPSHPGGPGRLVAVASVRIRSSREGPGVEPLRPVIHSGERLIVEENTAVVEARLEAVALGPAVIGSPLDVRLRIGGKVVRAVALAPGRASLQPEMEVRP